jgi:hypothetical protein
VYIRSLQGAECDVIIFTATRSNPHGKVGFLNDARRLNVALTRARHILCVLGDSRTLRHDDTWSSFIDFVEERRWMRIAILADMEGTQSLAGHFLVQVHLGLTWVCNGTCKIEYRRHHVATA